MTAMSIMGIVLKESMYFFEDRVAKRMALDDELEPVEAGGVVDGGNAPCSLDLIVVRKRYFPVFMKHSSLDTIDGLSFLLDQSTTVILFDNEMDLRQLEQDSLSPIR
ncbi:hypothetical protein G6L37_01820 [Agrobacterium rubi]|nr:hypothetical protein [Agrobacterium rubi]NTF24131.1 hypothetical protein [Agrobacterium rubi]